MATVILVRHAKGTSHDKGEDKDRMRPLAKKGENQLGRLSKEVKRFLKKERLKVDFVLTSIADRAVQTASAISKKLNIKKENIIVLEDLYLASVEKIESLVSEYLGHAKTILLVGHNPGLSAFVERMTGGDVKKLKTADWIAAQRKSKSSPFVSLPLKNTMPTPTKKSTEKKAAPKAVAKKAPTKKSTEKKVAPKATAKKAPTKKSTEKKVAPKATAKKAPTKKSTEKKATPKAAAKKALTKKSTEKKAAPKATAKKAPTKKSTEKKAAPKAAAKKAPVKKVVAKKPAVKAAAKMVAKKGVAKKAAPKAAAKKAPVKKVVAKKSVAADKRGARKAKK